MRPFLRERQPRPEAAAGAGFLSSASLVRDVVFIPLVASDESAPPWTGLRALHSTRSRLVLGREAGRQEVTTVEPQTSRQGIRQACRPVARGAARGVIPRR